MAASIAATGNAKKQIPDNENSPQVIRTQASIAQAGTIKPMSTNLDIHDNETLLFMAVASSSVRVRLPWLRVGLKAIAIDDSAQEYSLR